MQEEIKNTPGTFWHGIDPRINLAAFCLPPDVVFACLPGLLCGPPYPPYGLPHHNSILKLELFDDFCIYYRALTPLKNFSNRILTASKKIRLSKDRSFSRFLRAHPWEEPRSEQCRARISTSYFGGRQGGRALLDWFAFHIIKSS